MENFKIPLVLAVALGAQLVGAVFWGSNILRDISDNTARTDELIEILLETEEAIQKTEETLSEVDEEIWDDMDNLVKLQTQIIKIQARISILEKTVEFTQRDGM